MRIQSDYRKSQDEVKGLKTQIENLKSKGGTDLTEITELKRRESELTEIGYNISRISAIKDLEKNIIEQKGTNRDIDRLKNKIKTCNETINIMASDKAMEITRIRNLIRSENFDELKNYVEKTVQDYEQCKTKNPKSNI